MSQRHSSLVGRERVLAGWPCAARRGWPGVPPERRGPAPTAPAMPSHFHEKRVFLHHRRLNTDHARTHTGLSGRYTASVTTKEHRHARSAAQTRQTARRRLSQAGPHAGATPRPDPRAPRPAWGGPSPLAHRQHRGGGEGGGRTARGGGQAAAATAATVAATSAVLAASAAGSAVAGGARAAARAAAMAAASAAAQGG